MRFDTYRGCVHRCAYCFASVKNQDPSTVLPGEGPDSLCRWIAGGRTQDTAWCDWDIPLHWGGMSDPFQVIDLAHGRSLACLRVFAETGYPVVISTKGTLLRRRPYLELLERCNVCLQVSLIAQRFDALEPGAPRFAERLSMIRRVVPRVPRVIVRVQPYHLRDLAAVVRNVPRFADAGVHGIIVEGYKSKRRVPSLVRLGSDHVYPLDRLRKDFELIRDVCRLHSLRFYCGENRLRRMSGSRCCCGVDGLPGFRVNRANLNSRVFGRQIRYTPRMAAPRTAFCFKAISQDAVSTHALKRLTYRDCMEIAAETLVFREFMGLSSKGSRDIFD